jgi:hypothetical protein
MNTRIPRTGGARRSAEAEASTASWALAGKVLGAEGTSEERVSPVIWTVVFGAVFTTGSRE